MLEDIGGVNTFLVSHEVREAGPGTGDHDFVAALSDIVEVAPQIALFSASEVS